MERVVGVLVDQVSILRFQNDLVRAISRTDTLDKTIANLTMKLPSKESHVWPKVTVSISPDLSKLVCEGISLHESSTVAAKCTASGPGLTLACIGKDSSFTISAVDDQGKPAKLTSDEFEVSVIDGSTGAPLAASDSKSVVARCRVEPAWNYILRGPLPGHFKVTFTLPKPSRSSVPLAQYGLNVCLDGKHIAGSPFPRLRTTYILEDSMVTRLLSWLPQNRRNLKRIAQLSFQNCKDVFQSLTQGQILLVVQNNLGFVFGAYIEDKVTPGAGWIAGHADNFFFSFGGHEPVNIQLLKNKRNPNGVRLDQGKFEMGTGSDLFIGHVGGVLTGYCNPRSYLQRPQNAFGFDYKNLSIAKISGSRKWTPQQVEVFQCS